MSLSSACGYNIAGGGADSLSTSDGGHSFHRMSRLPGCSEFAIRSRFDNLFQTHRNISHERLQRVTNELMVAPAAPDFALPAAAAYT